MDSDSEILEYDERLHLFDFYGFVGATDFFSGGEFLVIGMANGFIGSVSHHPAIKEAL